LHELTACDAEPWQTEAGVDGELAGAASAEFVLAAQHAPGLGYCDPLDLLRPECAALPLLGRIEELAVLEAWLGGASPLSMHRIVGRAGSGKTRLAIELCRRAEANGWSAGFTTMQAITKVAAEGGHRWSRNPLLMVVDRSEDCDGLLVECCARFSHTQPHGMPLRVLLLDREQGASAITSDEIDSLPSLPEPVRLAGLRSVADRRALLGRAMGLAARLAGLPPCAPPTSAALDTGEPLHLLLAALVAPHQDVSAALARSPAELAGELADRELAKLERLASRQDLDPGLLRHLIACVTLQDGCPFDAAPSLVQQEAEAMGMHLPGPPDHLADCLADALLAADGETLESFGPAPIGEAFLLREVTRHAPERQAAIIDRSLHRAHGATAAKLRRIAELHGGNDPAHPAVAWSRQAGA
jgi:hypothetical protein